MTLRVCIIGAGASGLVCAQVLSSEDYLLKPTIFEQSDHLGGQWHLDSHGSSTTSAVYRDLKTNLPCGVMQFSDFPFPGQDSEAYVGPKEMEDYILAYAEKNQLKKFIRFNCQVISVDETFTVTYKTSTDAIQNDYNEYDQRRLVKKTEDSIFYAEQFDAVCVANGHYSEIYIPDNISGFNSRTFPISHSRSYRQPEIYRDRCVVVVGGSHSGIDIAGELSAVAKQVVLSLKDENVDYANTVLNLLQLSGKPICTDYTSSVFSFAPTIERIDKDCVIFSDQRSISPDHMIFATGYQYHMPFLKGKLQFDEECLMKNRYLYPLFKQLFHGNVPDGRLSLLAIPYRIVPFPLAELQSHIVARVLTGRLHLPSCEDMIKMIDHFCLPKNRSYHCVNMIDYTKDLLQWIETSDQYFNYKFTIDDQRRVRKQTKKMNSSRE